MEPAKLDDRELGCIDFFLFCCLLSSGLVWPTSWAILAPSWAILASSWTILAPSGAIRAPSWASKASPSFPRLNQTVPRGAHRSPEAPKAKIMKIWARRLAPFWGLNVMRVYHPSRARSILKKTRFSPSEIHLMMLRAFFLCCFIMFHDGKQYGFLEI